MDRNYVFTSTIISRGSVFSLHLSAAKERKEPNMCVCACVCLLVVSDGEGMCVSSQRGLC